MTKIFGRQNEVAQLDSLCSKSTASLAVIYGRRRIGKSTLVEHFGSNKRMLSFEGLSPRMSMAASDQLKEFSRQLVRECHIPYQTFKDWGDALYSLSQCVQTGPVVIFFDEISWMGLEDPDFPAKIKMAWDKYFKKNPNLIFILCSSASSWIKKHIVTNTGFHGRISLSLCLRELPLEDCAKFWGAHSPEVCAIEKLKILAATGGIPRYLEEVSPTLSADENLRRLAFNESGILFNDFSNIFSDTLMRKSAVYESIVRLLCDASKDIKEISSQVGMSSGGYLSELLDELISAGFIAKYASWNFKSGAQGRIFRYRLSDNYLRFYLKYIDPNISKIIAGHFESRSLSSLPGWSAMMGFAIENLVLSNRSKIIQSLGILPDVLVNDGPYYQRATKRAAGVQIDYLIETQDTIYLCEIKHTQSFIRKHVIDEMKTKVAALLKPKHKSYRTVLIYVGDLHEAIEGSDYFFKLIDLAEFLK